MSENDLHNLLNDHITLLNEEDIISEEGAENAHLHLKTAMAPEELSPMESFAILLANLEPSDELSDLSGGSKDTEITSVEDGFDSLADMSFNREED